MLSELTSKQLVKKIRNKEMTAEEFVSSSFERIRKLEEKVHAFITLNEDKALEKARKIDDKVSRGKPIGKLAGVTIAVKDNICTKGIRTTCASRMLENFVPPYNATVIEKIEKERPSWTMKSKSFQTIKN